MPQPLQLLAWDRSRNGSEWWRLLTAHLVHLNGWHLVLNLTGVVLSCELLWRHLPLRQVIGVMLASAATVAVGLWWLMPDLRGYAGLSGVLHGSWAGCALLLLFRPQSAQARPWWLFALALLVLKLQLERGAGTDAVAALIGGSVVTPAHVLGTAGGIAFAALMLWRPARLPSAN